MDSGARTFDLESPLVITTIVLDHTVALSVKEGYILENCNIAAYVGTFS